MTKIVKNVSIICFDTLGQLAMVHEIKENSPSAPGQRLEFDGFPSGKIEPDQTVEQAVIAEMKQETGCAIQGPFDTLYTVEKKNEIDGFHSHTTVVLAHYPGVFDLKSEDPDNNIAYAFTANLKDAIHKIGQHPDKSKYQPALKFLLFDSFDRHYTYKVDPSGIYQADMQNTIKPL